MPFTHAHRFNSKNINTSLKFIPCAVVLLFATPALADHDTLVVPSVEVKAPSTTPLTSRLTNTSGTADLLDEQAGVSVYSTGGVSGLPTIHGLADDRLRISVDGMDLVSSCANHMNPPLSYLAPSNVGAISILSSLVPVSLGGDSIGGTIIATSQRPAFAQAGEGMQTHARLNTFYRSNNNARGVNLNASVANDQAYLSYSGAYVNADNYKAGGDFKAARNAALGRGWLAGDVVGSSAYESQNHQLGFGIRHDNHQIDLKIGLQDIPFQGFANQRMDMTANRSQQFNLGYTGQYGWGELEARAYYEHTRHSMNFGNDKQYWYGNAPGMPMETEGTTIGAKLKADIAIGAADHLRVGGEYQRYRLDDWWPASGTGMMMSPNTFWNIRNGERDRYEAFAEWEKQWQPQWSTLAGVRAGVVKSNADNVQGYNNMGGMMGYGNPNNPASIPGAFNAADKSRSDNTLDITALARYTPNTNQQYEFGYAMKTRAPNLYERYVWANSNTMVLNMNNLYGDGNGYVGNLNLKPEKSHTLSATARWQDAANQAWSLNVTPYYTYVQDYIDAVSCASVGKTCATRSDGFVNLSLANKNAQLYGVDISGKLKLVDGSSMGNLAAKGVLSYVRGKNLSTGDNLYNIMPLNATLALEHQYMGWSNTLQAKFVDNKSNLQAIRKEIATPGYALFNFYSSYRWQHVRLDLGVENIFNKLYYLPLGGAYVGQGATMGQGVAYGTAVPGMGRSINVGLTLDY